jgi:predicted dehydrogenase
MLSITGQVSPYNNAFIGVFRMTTSPIGVGIIGVQPGRSWAALAHIPALQSLPDRYHIAAVCNTKQQSAEAAAREFNIPQAFDNVEQMVNCDAVDLVAVTVKVPHHRELVTQAIQAGKHVYCEWPLGNGLEEAREMAALAKSKGVVAVCGLQARFSATMAYVRDLIAQGYVGEVLSTSVIGSGMSWGPVTEQANAYNADIRNGASMLAIPVGHTLDAICQCLGEIASLQATLSNRRKTAVIAETGETIPMTAHDQVLINGTFESGAPVSVHYRGGMPRGTGLLWEINGSKGDLRVTAIGGHAQLLDLALSGGKGDEPTLAPMDIPQKYFEGLAPDARVGNVARFYAQLARDIGDGSSVCPTFADAVKRHQMIAAIETAAHNGTTARPASF